MADEQDERSDKERFYDEHVAPVLLDLAARCRERIPHNSVVLDWLGVPHVPKKEVAQ